jgi:hypothetical protein
MSFIDKIAAAIMPPESEQDRVNARTVAEALATQGDWLATVLDHHKRIEAAFAAALAADDAGTRSRNVRKLGVLLTGHSNAEEAAIYPALAEIGESASASMAYEEQAMAKLELAKLERLDAMSRNWVDTLEHLRGAVAHHMYEEEGKWFPELQQNLSPAERSHLNMRFAEEFERYMGTDALPGDLG